ncbi:MAG: transporter ATP-binding protein uup, partial [Pseudomonadota bacterium]
MTLLSFIDVTLEYGPRKLLDRVNFSLLEGERVCLIGRNGAGKSTLLSMCQGTLVPDSGEIVRKGALVVSELPQSLPTDLEITVKDYVARGLAEQAALIERFRQLSETQDGAPTLGELEALQQRIEAHGGWAV